MSAKKTKDPLLVLLRDAVIECQRLSDNVSDAELQVDAAWLTIMELTYQQELTPAAAVDILSARKLLSPEDEE